MNITSFIDGEPYAFPLLVALKALNKCDYFTHPIHDKKKQETIESRKEYMKVRKQHRINLEVVPMSIPSVSCQS